MKYNEHYNVLWTATHERTYTDLMIFLITFVLKSIKDKIYRLVHLWQYDLKVLVLYL